MSCRETKRFRSEIMATVSIDVIKLRTSQNKDGDTLTVRLNPADEIARDAILLARPGSPFRMVLTDLDDDGNPETSVGNASLAKVADLPLATEREARRLQPEESQSVKTPASRLTQLAGITCNDPLFWRYLSKPGREITNRDEARAAVHKLCDVDSRKEFIVGTPAGDRWLKFYDGFALWRVGRDVA